MRSMSFDFSLKTPRRGLRIGLVSLVLALEVATLMVPAQMASAQMATGLRDYPIPGGWFYSQESRLPVDMAPYRGYTVVDDGEAAFWTEFRRFGGVEVLGYPVSRRYHYPTDTGYLSQAFQRGILQWHPETGRAQMANVFEQFTEQGRDDLLENVGIPRPRPQDTTLGFADDAERRMGWLVEPRFLARYFFDPVTQSPFQAQEEAWDFFGLPQTAPERPVYMREKANGKYGAPLYLPYVAQRFQKAGLQLFLDDVPLDPTIVPGDGRKGCLAITAVGRLARRLGAGKLIPSLATQPEPLENPPTTHFVAYVPPTTVANQSALDFEMIGTGYQPGEPLTIKLIPVAPQGANQPLMPRLVSHVDAADADGSFDQMLHARIWQYTVSITGDVSGKTLDVTQDTLVNLAVPSTDMGAASKATYC
ncbi:MAG TPA: hypothetical protein VGQ62_06435 [Chloroflexota bacterium]|nr:hypothetical protein [Chloroflexota bacterium]